MGMLAKLINKQRSIKLAAALLPHEKEEKKHVDQPHGGR